MRKTLIIGHRGAPNPPRENTVESFHKAIEIGVDMIEFDVRRTKDDVLVVHHDELMEGRPIRELTYKDASGMSIRQGYSIPRLEEVLTSIGGKIKLDVEIKEEGYEKEVVESLLKYMKKDEFVITSFYGSCLRKIKEEDRDIDVGLILGVPESKPLILARLLECFPLKRGREVKADVLVPHWRLLRFGFLDRAKRAGKMVWVWTVNEEWMIWKMLRDERIDAIITDRPDLAISLRQKMDSQS